MCCSCCLAGAVSVIFVLGSDNDPSPPLFTCRRRHRVVFIQTRRAQLRKRLQLLTAREIENQRRLETFSRFAPLFDALDAYSSPADAMRRLSVLEQEQGSNYAKARQAEESLAKSTEVHTQLIRELEAKNAELSVELVRTVIVFMISDPVLAYVQGSASQPVSLSLSRARARARTHTISLSHYLTISLTFSPPPALSPSLFSLPPRSLPLSLLSTSTQQQQTLLPPPAHPSTPTHSLASAVDSRKK